MRGLERIVGQFFVLNFDFDRHIQQLISLIRQGHGSTKEQVHRKQHTYVHRKCFKPTSAVVSHDLGYFSDLFTVHETSPLHCETAHNVDVEKHRDVREVE